MQFELMSIVDEMDGFVATAQDVPAWVLDRIEEWANDLRELSFE